MTASAWDDDWTAPDYRNDHTHPLVIRALTTDCEYCGVRASQRCDGDALVHYSRVAYAAGMGTSKRGGKH